MTSEPKDCDNCQGLDAELQELIRVSMTRKTDVLHQFIKDNWPAEYKRWNTREPGKE